VQVSEGIHRLTQGVTNFYLISESGKYTVVDAGTPGGWLFEDRRTLVTGDVLATENALTGRIGPQIMPDGLNEDGAQALASLDALLGVEADLLLPGHGDPWTEGVAEAVRRAKAAGRS
jgi:glyoxylase-like metal-dependent hydrolase (beta-lactamase superfamily II)